MVKICHLTSAHSNLDVRIMQKECITLKKSGYDVYLIAKGESGEYNGVKIVGIGSNFRGRLQRFLMVRNIVYKKALQLNAEVYHIHDPELLPYALKLKKKGKLVIYDSHEYVREQLKTRNYLPKILRGIIGKLFGIYEDFIIDKLDAVIFPVETYDGDKLFSKAKKVTFINNYPKLEECRNYLEADSDNYSNSVCYVGTLTYERGIYHLIKACYKARVQLILAGQYGSKEFEKQVKKMPEYSCVQYKGFVGREGVYQIYKESFVGANILLPVGQYYKSENLSTKVYEYMMMKMPTILSDTPYNKKLVEKYQFGLIVDPENIEDITAAILYLKNHREEAKIMGEKGARLVQEQFCWEREGEKLIQLYNNILKTG